MTIISESEELKDVLLIHGVNAKGYGIIPKIVMQDSRLTIESKAIYAYFCSFAGAGITAFPSVGKLRNDLNISKDRYYKHFGKLKEFGYVLTDQENTKGKFKRNVYTLVQNPEVILENKELPRPCFTDTEITYTQNKDTKRNSTKRNNIIKLSVNQSKDKLSIEDQQMLKSLFEQCEVHCFPNESVFIKNSLEDLYQSESIKISNRVLDQKKIRESILMITHDILVIALKRYKDVSENKTIANMTLYFQKVLLTVILEDCPEGILNY